MFIYSGFFLIVVKLVHELIMFYRICLYILYLFFSCVYIRLIYELDAFDFYINNLILHRMFIRYDVYSGGGKRDWLGHFSPGSRYHGSTFPFCSRKKLSLPRRKSSEFFQHWHTQVKMLSESFLNLFMHECRINETFMRGSFSPRLFPTFLKASQTWRCNIMKGEVYRVQLKIKYLYT